MSEHSPTRVEAIAPPEVLRQSLRDRWASTWAAFLTTTHFIAILIILGWYYFIVPRAKHQLDEFGVELTQTAVQLIRQSDFLVNYWYLLAPIGPPVLIADFVLMRWMTKQLGLRTTLVGGACITLLLFMIFAYGQYVLSGELVRLRAVSQSPRA